ncbi:MAG: TRAP transporter substrate-binding protein DctP [Woeseiaceae bacterium]|nr:TRAP transporter substrate-binding protein DctP [Woeseiaceae bacterium]
MRNPIPIIAGLMLALMGGMAAAQTTEIKIATLAPENSGWMKEFRQGATEIRERTDGRVRLKFYSGGVQGNERQVLRKMQIGQLHGGTFAPTDFQKRYPDVNIYGLPFLFKSIEEVEYVREHLDAGLIAGIEDLGFETFGFAGGGFAIILSNEPVRSHDDLKGKKVWLPEGDQISYQGMKSLDLSPVSLPITDVLTGLQTGLIDIVAIPPVVALALQWHTKVKYVTRMPVLYAMGFMVIGERKFNQLSEPDQAVVRDVMTGIYEDVDAASQRDSRNATEALLSVGLEEVEPVPGEFEKIRDQMQETNRDMAEQGMFSARLLDELLMHLQDYRAAAASKNDEVTVSEAH